MIEKTITKEQFDTLCDLLDVVLTDGKWFRARSDEERKDMKILNRRGLVGRMDAIKKSGKKESFWKCNEKGAEYIVENWNEFYPDDSVEKYSSKTDEEFCKLLGITE